ncbi:hypothetical protein FRB95_005273, partial [Tulasnella sp. JGI-2019a]
LNPHDACTLQEEVPNNNHDIVDDLWVEVPLGKSGDPEGEGGDLDDFTNANLALDAIVDNIQGAYIVVASWNNKQAWRMSRTERLCHQQEQWSGQLDILAEELTWWQHSDMWKSSIANALPIVEEDLFHVKVIGWN